MPAFFHTSVGRDPVVGPAVRAGDHPCGAVGLSVVDERPHASTLSAYRVSVLVFAPPACHVWLENSRTLPAGMIDGTVSVRWRVREGGGRSEEAAAAKANQVKKKFPV